jgi:quercetin dioxygenase-like cupin family protein
MKQADKQGRAACVVKPAAAVEYNEIPAATATAMQVLLGPADGVPNFTMRRVTIGEGGSMPAHTNSVEHVQYVLGGRAEVGIDGQTFDVEAGYVLYIPGGAPHYYKVSEGPFEFLCIVPNAEDRIEILEQR